MSSHSRDSKQLTSDDVPTHQSAWHAPSQIHTSVGAPLPQPFSSSAAQTMPTYLDENWTSTPAAPPTHFAVLDTLLTTGQATRPMPQDPPAALQTCVALPNRPSSRRRSRALLRYGSAALILAGIAVYLAPSYLGPELAITDVSVESASKGRKMGCGEIAQVTGYVITNGAPGVLVYQWIRNDGSTSGILEEKLTRGQRSVSLRLNWAVSGHGTYQARATLKVISPTAPEAFTAFTYQCENLGLSLE
ncbi:hypothetical protein ACFQ71_39960 [Streptomyces sp. NPDC056534]|uniref:hypothetical protein n=1 Tax=Streptomyces sp. NPDC056534 TaxID=3345857 RepID=UPI0036BEF99A